MSRRNRPNSGNSRQQPKQEPIQQREPKEEIPEKYKIEVYDEYKMFCHGRENCISTVLNKEYAEGWRMVKIFIDTGNYVILFEKC